MNDALHWASLAQLQALMASGRRQQRGDHPPAARPHRGARRPRAVLHPPRRRCAGAARAAVRRRRGGSARPLLGIPIALKDNYVSRGQPTTAGTTAPGISFPQDADSACAERLRAAGCVIIGKTPTHEFAWGTINPPTANPWDLERIPGGSILCMPACRAIA